MWRRLSYSLLIVVLASLSYADTLLVVGQSRQSPAHFIEQDGELLAPLASSLPSLGIKLFEKKSVIALVTHRHAIRMTPGKTAVTLDGQAMDLPVAPRYVSKTLYLPVRSLLPLLDTVVAYSDSPKTLTLTPMIAVHYTTDAGKVAVDVQSNIPLVFTKGALGAPPRVYFDFAGVSLGLIEQQIPVACAPVVRLRLSRFSLSPPTVRLVADLTAPSPVTVEPSDNGRMATLSFAGQGNAVSRPPAEQMAASRGTVRTATLESCSVQQSILTVTTDTAMTVTAIDRPQVKQLTLTFPQAASSLSAVMVRQLKDGLVKKAQAGSSRGETRLTLTFTKAVCYQVQQQGTTVRVILDDADMHGVSVVLDAGHGGGDPGSVGNTENTREKGITLAVTLRAVALLRAAGATVQLTRDADTRVQVEDRAAFANRSGATLFVAVHCNSAPEDLAGGTETLYGNDRSLPLAQVLHNALMSSLQRKDRGVRSDTRHLCVLHACTMPSVLVELAFLSNATEEGLLRSPEFQQRAAEGIFAGIRQYTACLEETLPPAGTAGGSAEDGRD